MSAKIHFAIVLTLAIATFSASSCGPRNLTQRAAESTSFQPAPSLRLQTEIAQIASEAKGRVGVSGVILETNETLASLNPQDHFPMQSVYKLPISMAVMRAVDAGKLRLDEKE